MYKSIKRILVALNCTQTTHLDETNTVKSSDKISYRCVNGHDNVHALSEIYVNGVYCNGCNTNIINLEIYRRMSYTIINFLVYNTIDFSESMFSFKNIKINILPFGAKITNTDDINIEYAKFLAGIEVFINSIIAELIKCQVVINTNNLTLLKTSHNELIDRIIRKVWNFSEPQSSPLFVIPPVIPVLNDNAEYIKKLENHNIDLKKKLDELIVSNSELLSDLSFTNTRIRELESKLNEQIQLNAKQNVIAQNDMTQNTETPNIVIENVTDNVNQYIANVDKQLNSYNTNIQDNVSEINTQNNTVSILTTDNAAIYEADLLNELFSAQ